MVVLRSKHVEQDPWSLDELGGRPWGYLNMGLLAPDPVKHNSTLEYHRPGKKTS
jgi:hypothetical protein